MLMPCNMITVLHCKDCKMHYSLLYIEHHWRIYFDPSKKRGVLYSGVYKVLALLTWDLDRSVL